MIKSIEWLPSGHKQKRYDLSISRCGHYFKKSTNRLHKTLKTELECLSVIRDANLIKIQQLVDGDIDTAGTSYIVTEHCGRNLKRSLVPIDWREQLDIIDVQLDILMKDYKIFHNDVQMRNIFIKHDSLTLIDFDLATVGKPNRRSSKRPCFLKCDLIREKITNRWCLE
jgi:hypothetical protein